MPTRGRRLGRTAAAGLIAIVSAAATTLPAGRLPGQVLSVGPGQLFAKPSTAFTAARDGDTIRIDAAGDYYNDVAVISRSNLTIEGVGKTRAVLKTDGRVYSRKGIWVFDAGASNLTIRNLDFQGARVADVDGANGAGLRALGTDLTVDNCRFHDNQNGILGGYGTTTIQHSEFDHNGLNGLAHNIYIGDSRGTLIFKFNYTHDTKDGHLLKSRAAVNVVEYNRIADEAGTGSYELDFPNGGRTRVVGNLIEQSAGSQNGVILAYGEEGVVDPKSALYVVGNTFINRRPAGTFIDVQKTPAGFQLIARNNIVAGPGTVSTRPAITGGNVLTTVEGAGFVDAANGDFRINSASPARSAGVQPGDDADRKPLALEFRLAGAGDLSRPFTSDTPDAGAFGRQP